MTVPTYSQQVIGHLGPARRHISRLRENEVAYATVAREMMLLEVQQSLERCVKEIEILDAAHVAEAARLKALVKRLTDKLRVFVNEHDDPGADALACIWCGEQENGQ